MQKKNGEDLYGYDEETDTVRVRRHDLWRLLLTFRGLVERDGGRSWSHMYDYDVSFERLADAVDASNHRFYRHDWSGPDYRMRCDRSAAYRWPKGAPYDGGEVTTVRVKDGAVGTDRGSHYVPAPMGEWPRALCGLSFVPEEAKPVAGEPTCPECRRELVLVKHLRPSKEQGESRTDGR